MNKFKEKDERKPNPLLEASFLSKWFFWWTRETFKRGYREQLQPEDLYAHIPTLDSRSVSFALIKHWEKEVRRKKPNLLHMIFRAYGWKFVPICILYSILEISIHSSQPLFLGGLVSYFAEGQTDISKQQAYLYATGIVVCSLVATLCFHPFMFYLFEVGTRIRLACSGLVYRKCLRSSVTADNRGMSGFAIAVLSSDLPQFDMTFYFFHDLWKGPIEACIMGYLMYLQVGWPAIAGLVFIIIFIPLQAWAAKASAHFRYESAEHGDDRVNLMNEIITAMQVIKMYAWEKSFAKLIAIIRKKEVKAIRGSMNIYAALQCTDMISKCALFISLVAYVYTGDIVTAKKVFIVSSYYDVLNDSLLHFWPLAVTTWAETVVCARRVVMFLMQSEDPADGGIENFAMEDDDDKGNFSGRVHNPRAIKKGVILHNLTASWDKVDSESRRKHIDNVSAVISENQFVGIVGNVGSGKTTLLNAVLGELEIVNGNVEVNGQLSYAPQEAWIFEGSIRDNIVFVEKFDESRYKAVLHACELERDISLFPYGDSTIVGERGISLSGGQKARISLARAVYRKADIYVFDDPLSAVDSHVGQLLLRKCFNQFLANKIRILVTHHIHHLKNSDHLILMGDGRVIEQGPYETLKHSIVFRALLEQEEEENNYVMKHRASIIDTEMKDSKETIGRTTAHDKGEDRKENQMQGSVRLHTYLSYFQALGMPWVIIFVFMLFIMARACQALMDIFISRWATWEETLPSEHDAYQEYTAKRKRMVLIYSILIICTLILYILRTFGFFMICLKISLRLHDSLFNGIIRSYMYFFNTNPSGRILNRFSSDISNIDVALPQAMLDSISFIVNAVAVLVVVATANYWLLIPAFIMILLLYACRGLYIGASRSLKRIEVMTRSPVYSHTNQTFQGLTTIRALHATRHLEAEFHDHQNNNTSALYLYVTTNRAFAFWTDLICVLYILAVTFSFLLINQEFYSGDVGLAITQSMSLVIMCQWGMRQTAEMENNMTSVERVVEYIELPTEPSLETDPSVRLPESWPALGRIHFKDLKLKYSEKGDYVLKGLNFSIKPTEKIGIVGRTGAGKSSIIQAIFRLARNDGLLDIDGFDVEKLGLHDLRSRISIIPQDPVLFSGALRFNLDPFDERTDEEIWRALDDVKLKSYVKSLEGGLSTRVFDGGSNFSMGQRQLICMARAILRHNKILIMDEATANVDPETDKFIQEAIHTKFDKCTVLTIAHRLHTVMDNDRVLVMDAGSAVELGHPYQLLQNPDGHLFKFVEKTGPGTAKYLHYIAEQSYKKRVTNKKSE
ncbi:probable multidrug resistance-associated protein lethal(2)03659 [Musca vetustissima]|uniref:probable multidrug resistance-associated protein lethal(2)03659 n=1 Tax=Musca vetustissima TaxID=27455 RepID=UPI002AB6F947|nr:probable multidrug resistance-associated protein lethal(2)03659 [Musca vetustissima]